jgi:hypothetical protein
MVMVKLLGMVDLLAALIIALVTVPIIGNFKWIIVAVLLGKSIPSLLG